MKPEVIEELAVAVCNACKFVRGTKKIKFTFKVDSEINTTNQQQHCVGQCWKELDTNVPRNN